VDDESPRMGCHFQESTEMTDRKTIFDSSEIRSTLADVKTQFCFPVQPQPDESPLLEERTGPIPWKGGTYAGHMFHDEWTVMRNSDYSGNSDTARSIRENGWGSPICLMDRWTTPYKPDDRFWIQETWRMAWASNNGLNGPGVRYEADGVVLGRTESQCNGVEDEEWRLSGVMPYWASRIWIEVEVVFMERLQRMSERIARVHGYESVEEFRVVWDSKYEESGFGWLSNCWIWVVEFKRIKE